jgi:hypothetical protein
MHGMARKGPVACVDVEEDLDQCQAEEEYRWCMDLEQEDQLHADEGGGGPWVFGVDLPHPPPPNERRVVGGGGTERVMCGGGAEPWHVGGGGAPSAGATDSP